MNFDYIPHTADSESIWTSGTRKQCNGQYSWCFSKPITHDMLDSQTLASSSSSGACVLATRNPKSFDKKDYAFINEDCNTKAKNFCYFFGDYTRPSFIYVRIWTKTDMQGGFYYYWGIAMVLIIWIFPNDFA